MEALRLYFALAKLAFRRQLAYRTANLAGLATNGFFGYLRATVFTAVFLAAPGGTIAEYDAQAMVSYTWATQALIMVVQLWGWWDVETTIRTGDVVTDLSRPFSYLGYWLARDLGRAAYFLLFRGLPTLLIGHVTLGGGLRLPDGIAAWLALAVSLVLAVTISFAWRFLLNLSAFWTTDARGLGGLANGMVLFLGGFVMPVRFFPDWLQPIVLALPFTAIVQVPADIFVGRLNGLDALMALGQQALWASTMLLAAQLVVVLAMRRVSIQGG
jgi:ABC-2 type transport system permease protein